MVIVPGCTRSCLWRPAQCWGEQGLCLLDKISPNFSSLLYISSHQVVQEGCFPSFPIIYMQITEQKYPQQKAFGAPVTCRGISLAAVKQNGEIVKTRENENMKLPEMPRSHTAKLTVIISAGLSFFFRFEDIKITYPFPRVERIPVIMENRITFKLESSLKTAILQLSL